MVLHFSDKHPSYISAYRYVAKEDEDIVKFPDDHPDLTILSSPKTSKGIQANKGKRRSSAAARRQLNQQPAPGPSSRDTDLDFAPVADSVPSSKRPKLSLVLVTDFILENSIKSRRDMWAHATARRENGDDDLVNFMIQRPNRVLDELIQKSWEMTGARVSLQEENTSSIDIIRSGATGQCVMEGCTWFMMALQLMRWNHVDSHDFAKAVRDNIIHGRAKGRPVMVVGKSNRGKTFLFKPLADIFPGRIFRNPAHEKYAWVAAENARVILLNDFRWDPQLIEWPLFLNLLEDEPVQFPAPKNHYTKNITLGVDVAVFATSKSRVEWFGPYRTTDPSENEMMDNRWNVFEFTYKIPKDEQKKIPPCPACFCRFVLMGE